ncbi:hypothetical protein [Pseudoduganella violaceinigra]|uniref:hypothetical protein n=1 Tax=Pseudoduganella violaceinigra TaxID=246602 RepID=UPI0012B58E40|nr:hypothetical protein [Pseudoduganella violaceinigra]
MFSTQAKAGECALARVKLIALGAEDNRIVLQMPDLHLHEMAVGEEVPGTDARLAKLLQAAAVFELPPSPGGEGMTVRLNKDGSVQCFKSSAPPSVSRSKPQVLTQPVGKAPGNDASGVVKNSN